MRILLLAIPLLVCLPACKKTPPDPTRTETRSVDPSLKGVARTDLDNPNLTDAQVARRTRNIGTIRKMGLPAIDHLPVVDDESAVKLRSPAEVAKRCRAALMTAVKGEGRDKALVGLLSKELGVAPDDFSPREKMFMNAGVPSKQELIDFSWRYECVHVFLWALKARATLVQPNKACPVTEEMALVPKAGKANPDPKLELRSAAEVLDMADLYYRLHWAATELRLRSERSDKIDEEIVRERHRALNWLIRYLNQEWDDVTTDT